MNTISDNLGKTIRPPYFRGADAIDPSTANTGLHPEQFRQYLGLVARMHLGPHQRARIDASDMVQETLLDAFRQRDRFRGSTEAEMAAWLRRILSCNIADAFRALACQKRSAALERSLDASLDGTCSRLEEWLGAIETSPSGKVCRSEQLLRLACAMDQLPARQREAIELHHLHGMSLVETAEQLDRSLGSVVGLCRRGLTRLRERLAKSGSRIG